jgi:hypothetical protein
MAHRGHTGLPVRPPWSCPGLPSAVGLAAAGRSSDAPPALDALFSLSLMTPSAIAKIDYGSILMCTGLSTINYTILFAAA